MTAHGAEHRHGYAKYLVVAVVLTVITIIEIVIPSRPEIRDALTRPGVVASLLVLSFVKGIGVVAYGGEEQPKVELDRGPAALGRHDACLQW